jgi:hypothetical protein
VASAGAGAVLAASALGLVSVDLVSVEDKAVDELCTVAATCELR